MKNLLHQLKHNAVPLLVAALMTVATFALYSPSISYDFINYDDDVYVYENPHVLNGLSWENVKYAFTTDEFGTPAALTWLTLEIDSTLLGTKAGAYRTTNIVLHGLTGALLFLAMLGLLKRFWPSLLVAGVFLLHPLRTESVIWVTERKDVLFGFFWAAGLLAYARYCREPKASRWLLVFLCYLGGMMSKFMMATFPFVLLLLDFWPLNRAGNDWASLRSRLWLLVREKIPFFIACIAFHRLTVAALENNESFHPARNYLGNQFLRVLHNYGSYVAKIFWPFPRALFYPMNPLVWQDTLSIVLVLVITGLAVWQLWKRPWLAVGWFWFLGTFTPVIGIVTFGHTFVADRYAYIPSIGLTLIAVVLLDRWLQGKAWEKTARIVLPALLFSACTVATLADMPRWQNSITVCESSLRVGDHPAAYNNLSAAYNDAGAHDHAIAVTTRAIALYPRNPSSYINRGLAYLGLGNVTNAEADFEQVIALSPERPEGYMNRGYLRTESGDWSGAAADFSKAIQLNPRNVNALNNRGTVHLNLGEIEAALADFTQAIQLRPTFADAWMNRGNTYCRISQPERGLQDLRQAIALYPNNPLYYANRAAAYFDLKRYDLARRDVARCETLGGHAHPGLVQALQEAKP